MTSLTVTLPIVVTTQATAVAGLLIHLAGLESLGLHSTAELVRYALDPPADAGLIAA